ncbi:LOW QUALITY PROTEIN: hypothetical protein IFM46972_11443 [Aspergillus udagawae]|uniref:40S ribosomal protein S21 n=1 Tax=Aspergillus udagawae TaxID=91492 RepID=A0A8H3SH57_9EURO|nr:LOW QUALITY PROTEIN: hypothetical protein IFM46972_11443 [Aspergillus udagawae]
MENEKGEIIDLYVPRGCSATNYPSLKSTTTPLSRSPWARLTTTVTELVRTRAMLSMASSVPVCNDSLNHLTPRDGYVRNVWAASR